MVVIVKSWESEQSYNCHQIELNEQEFSQLCKFLITLSPAEFDELELDSSTTLQLTIYQDVLNPEEAPRFGWQDRLWLWGCGLISFIVLTVMFAGVFQILSWITQGD